MEKLFKKSCAALLSALILVTAFLCPLTAWAAQTESQAVEAGIITVSVTAEMIEEQGAFAAIQGALDLADRYATDASLYKVVVAPGDYELTESLQILSNTWLSLDGVVLRRSGLVRNLLYAGREAENMEVTGYHYRNITVEGGTFNGSAGNGTMLKFAHARNVLLKNVTVTNNADSHMMEIAGVDGFTVSGCTFVDQIVAPRYTEAYEAIQIDIIKSGNFEGYRAEDLSVKNVLIENSLFRNCPRGVGSHTAVLNNPHQNIVIRNNTFENMGSVAIQTLNWTQSTITGNLIDTTPRGIAVYSARHNADGTVPSAAFAEEGGTEAHFPDEIPTYWSNIFIENNTIVHCGEVEDQYASYERAAISVLGGSVTSDRIPEGDYPCVNVAVKHNKIQMRGNGVRVEYARNIVVEGNEINATGTSNKNDYGIVLRNGVTNAYINKNYITDTPINGIQAITGCAVKQIVSNEIYTTGNCGVTVNDSKVELISNNEIRDTGGYGIFATKGSKVTKATENRLMRTHKTAIYAADTSYFGFLDHNTAYDCSGSAPYDYYGWNYTYANQLTAVTLADTAITLCPGARYRVSKHLTPPNALYDFFYSSSDESVAAVDDAGLVTAVGEGRATLSVTAGGITEWLTVNVQSDEPAFICGDLSGDGLVTDADYALLAGYLAKWEGYSSVDRQAADVNADGNIDTKDRIILARHLDHVSGYETLPMDVTGESSSGKLTVSSAEAKHGETVSITMRLSENPGIANLTAAISFDETALQLEQVNDERLFSGADIQHSDRLQAPYQATWIDDLTAADNHATGDLLTLTFRVLDTAKAGSYPVSVISESVESYNAALERVSFAVSAGAVTVLPKTTSVSGTVSGSTVDEAALVSLTAEGQDEPSATATDSGSGYLFEKVQVGAYILRVVRMGYVPAQAQIEVTETPVRQDFTLRRYGDVNDDGAVTIADATLLQQYLAEFTVDGAPVFDDTDALTVEAADANGDGKLTIDDVTVLQRYIAEYIQIIR